MKSTASKIALACVASFALVSQASAEQFRNLFGGYEIKKNGVVVSAYSWVMRPQVGATSAAGSTDRVGVAKECGNALSSVQIFAGRNVSLQIVSLDRKNAKFLADVAIGEITGEGKYPLDGCMATGPIVKQIRKQVLVEVADGEKREVPLEDGYSIAVRYSLQVE